MDEDQTVTRSGTVGNALYAPVGLTEMLLDFDSFDYMAQFFFLMWRFSVTGKISLMFKPYTVTGFMITSGDQLSIDHLS